MRFFNKVSTLCCGTALALSAWMVAPQAYAAEVYDNEKLLKALDAGIDLSVIFDQIAAAEKVNCCHFNADTEAIIAIQKKAGAMSKEDIQKLQKKVLALANKDQDALKTLVVLSVNVWENYAPTDEIYERQMRMLLKEGKAVVPFLLEKLFDQNSESYRKKSGNLDALSRIGDRSKEVVTQITPLLIDRDKPVRLQAAKAVAALSNDKTLEDLIARMSNLGAKIDGVVLAVGYMGDPNPKAISALTRVLKSSLDSDARVCAAFSLGELRAKSTESLDTLLEAVLDERDEELRNKASLALAKIGDKRTPSYIRRAVERFRNGGDALIRNLAYFKDTETVEFLLEQLRSSDRSEIKKASLDTLSVISGGEKYTDIDEWSGWWLVAQTRPDFRAANETPKLPEPRGSNNKHNDNANPINTSVVP